MLHTLSCFIAEWEVKTCRKLPDDLKKDVYSVCHPPLECISNLLTACEKQYIRNELTEKYGLRTEHRERYLVTKKDLDCLLYRLFGADDHDYPHERSRCQNGFALSLFAGSAARAGAIVEASSYPGSNEALYYEVCPSVFEVFRLTNFYKHLVLNMKWTSKGRIKYWVTIDQKFLKGRRYTDDGDR